MRILYDGSIYKLQRFGGINTYIANLIRHLPIEYCPLVTTVDPLTQSTLHHPQLQVAYYHRFGLRPNRISFALEPIFFNWVEFWSRAEILHPTFYFALSQRQWQRYQRPIVATIHDLIHELFPTIDPHQRVRQVRLELLKAASAIICVSEHTRQDLFRFYPFTRSRFVTVIPLATALALPDFPTAAAPLATAPLEPPYFLSVGGRWTYKNMDLLWRAIAHLKTRYPDVRLKVVGAPFSPAEQARFAELGVTDRVMQVTAPDDLTLARLYHHSLALIYPSLYEGFGLPPLEAMACGTVAIAAQAASIPEVVGTAGLLFNPHALEELVAHMTWVLEHPAGRDRLIAAGAKRVQAFSWAKVAAQTGQIYQSLV